MFPGALHFDFCWCYTKAVVTYMAGLLPNVTKCLYCLKVWTIYILHTCFVVSVNGLLSPFHASFYIRVHKHLIYGP